MNLTELSADDLLFALEKPPYASAASLPGIQCLQSDLKNGGDTLTDADLVDLKSFSDVEEAYRLMYETSVAMRDDSHQQGQKTNTAGAGLLNGESLLHGEGLLNGAEDGMYKTDELCIAGVCSPDQDGQEGGCSAHVCMDD